MALESINPANGEVLQSFSYWERSRLQTVLKSCAAARQDWQGVALSDRTELLRAAAKVLRDNKEDYARIITLEMGKLINDARAEVEKCALVCDYYAEHAAEFLADEIIETDAGKSYVTYQPMGTVLAVMPWNFPFWQVFRFAAPALAAGNIGLLKHASNVPQCALAIEEVFRQAGFPEHVFTTLMIPASVVADVIADDAVHAVTLTGSEPAGRQVGSRAGEMIKHSVLELGGSDPFIVLPDADMEQAVKWGVTSRYLNTGQSCIAAKRFILVGEAADSFLPAFKTAVEALQPGDPLEESTTLGPMARVDLRDELHQQVCESLEQGAVIVTGCAPVDGPGAYYQPSIMDHVKPGVRAYNEELFGPVAIVIRAADVEQAIRIANGSRFGLGGSVWTADTALGEQIALRLECGAAFVNGMVKSDPRLPFGGVKASGYGRELCHHGIREFVNVKSVWIA